MRIFHFILVLIIGCFMCSCRSTSKVAEQVVNQEWAAESNEKLLDNTSVTSKTASEDSCETVSITITTEYDTDKTDKNGKSPVKRAIVAIKGKKKGSKNNTTTEAIQNISATKNESANQSKQENNRREGTRAETKQPLYFSYILFGVAFVILMAILAYWVFTKYRAARPQINN